MRTTYLSNAFEYDSDDEYHSDISWCSLYGYTKSRVAIEYHIRHEIQKERLAVTYLTIALQLEPEGIISMTV